MRVSISKDDEDEGLEDEDDDGDEPNNPPLRNIAVVFLDYFTGDPRSNKAWY